jgi:GT2 family glycosyltransferase
LQTSNHRPNDTRPYGLFLNPGTLFSSFRSVYRLFHSPIPVTQLETGIPIQQPDWVSGSLIFLARHTFDQLNGWDEDYWMYYEDMDLCRRVRNQGGEIALLLNVTIIHNHGGASRINAATRALTKSEVMISKHVYVSKHFSHQSQAIAHSMLAVNNLLLLPLFLALLGLLFWFIPSMKTHAALYKNMMGFYFSAFRNKKWISPRSFRY